MSDLGFFDGDALGLGRTPTYFGRCCHKASAAQDTARRRNLGDGLHSGLFRHGDGEGLDIFYESFERGRTSGTMLDLPAWVAELPVAIGFALLSVQSVIEIVGLLRGKDIPKGAHE